MIRLHKGSSLDGAADLPAPRRGDPGGEVPAKASFTGPSSTRPRYLQREKTGGSPALVAIAYTAVASIALSLLVLLTWSLHRLAFPPRPGLRRSRDKAATASSTAALQR